MDEVTKQNKLGGFMAIILVLIILVNVIFITGLTIVTIYQRVKALIQRFIKRREKKVRELMELKKKEEETKHLNQQESSGMSTHKASADNSAIRLGSSKPSDSILDHSIGKTRYGYNVFPKNPSKNKLNM